MRTRHVEALLSLAYQHGEPVCLTSPPGCGKTHIQKRVTNRLGFHLWQGHPAISEPVDFKGYPMAWDENGRKVCQFIPDTHLYRLLDAAEPTVAFLDDLIQAPQATQAALMQLIEERRLNGHQISPHVVFAVATNDAGHMAGGTSIIEPLKGRFTIIQLTPNVDDWYEWGLNLDQALPPAGQCQPIVRIADEMPPVLLAFVRNHPDLLSQFKGSKKLTDKSPDPRSWARVGRWFQMGVTPAVAGGKETWRQTIQTKDEDELEATADLIAHEVYSGCVGEGASTQFCAYVKLVGQMPDLNAILADPAKAPVSDKPDVNFVVCNALARQATVKNFGQIMTYLWRMEQPFRFLCIKDVMRIDKARCEKAHAQGTVLQSIMNTAPYTAWIARESHVFA